jgi:hypothetical protein
MRLVLRRLRTLTGFAVLCTAGAVVFALLAYAQAQANSDCLTLAVCNRERPGFGDPSAPCKNLGCGGLDPWVFGIPAVILGVAALIAIVVLILRRGGGGSLVKSGQV